jgi:hypothetical protein
MWTPYYIYSMVFLSTIGTVSGACILYIAIFYYILYYNIGTSSLCDEYENNVVGSLSSSLAADNVLYLIFEDHCTANCQYFVIAFILKYGRVSLSKVKNILLQH